LWDLATKREIKRLSTGDLPMTAIAYSGDGKVLRGSWGSREIRRWDVATGQELAPIISPDDSFPVLALSRDGEFLATRTLEPPAIGARTERDCLIGLWNRRTGKKAQQFPAGCGDTEYLCFAHNSRALVAKSRRLEFVEPPRAGIYIWELPGGKLKRYFAEGDESFNAIAVSPDGRQLLTGYFQHRLRLWDIETGKVLRELGEKGIAVYNATFSPDGKLIVAVVGQTSIHVWSAATGDELACFRGHRGWISGVDVSPDGKFLASAGADTSVLIWDLSRALERSASTSR